MFSKPALTKIISAIGLLWLAAMVVGAAMFWHYENKPGRSAASPANWPSESRIVPSPDHPTLVIVAHPHCPCTRATVHELARIMSDYDGRLTAYVIFVRPSGVDEDWERTDNWESAERIPGVTVLKDDGGTEAAVFDAYTSGQTMLYGADGELLFTGGITAGRGQEGVSMGETAIATLLDGSAPAVHMTSVYGCPLLDDETYCRVKHGESK